MDKHTKESFPNSYRKWWLQNPLVLGINIIFTTCVSRYVVLSQILLSCLLTKLYSIWLDFHSNAVQGVKLWFQDTYIFHLKIIYLSKYILPPLLSTLWWYILSAGSQRHIHTEIHKSVWYLNTKVWRRKMNLLLGNQCKLLQNNRYTSIEKIISF